MHSLRYMKHASHLDKSSSVIILLTPVVHSFLFHERGVFVLYNLASFHCIHSFASGLAIYIRSKCMN